MIKPIPTVQIVQQRTLRECIDKFLEDQFYCCTQSKVHRLESFKTDLLSKIHREGLTDENLLMGLELNNYLRQLNSSDCRLGRVSYNIGE